jgi:hypothetical protein
MTYFLSILVTLSLIIAPFSAANAKKPARKSGRTTVTKKRKGDDLAKLQKWMAGYFSSQQQAAKDSDYFDVRLRATPIWPKRTDGYWLYVEQALAEHQQRPYRQRVYHLTQADDTTFESSVYAFNEPSRFVGEWQKPEPLAGLTPDSLVLKQGCSIILHKSGEIAFVGGTVDANCPSEVKGADYNTSEVTISKDQIISWDRGFDKERNQVWGTRKGGYVFKRLDDYPKPDSSIR